MPQMWPVLTWGVEHIFQLQLHVWSPDCERNSQTIAPAVGFAVMVEVQQEKESRTLGCNGAVGKCEAGTCIVWLRFSRPAVRESW
jgi:hypothetical protein